MPRIIQRMVGLHELWHLTTAYYATEAFPDAKPWMMPGPCGIAVEKIPNRLNITVPHEMGLPPGHSIFSEVWASHHLSEREGVKCGEQEGVLRLKDIEEAKRDICFQVYALIIIAPWAASRKGLGPKEEGCHGDHQILGSMGIRRSEAEDSWNNLYDQVSETERWKSWCDGASQVWKKQPNINMPWADILKLKK